MATLESPKSAASQSEAENGNDGGERKKPLEYWLTRSTDPYLVESSRPEFIHGFCEQVNDELEGPQIAARLLSHKIQSPNDVEAMHGLTVLEACVQQCGNRFHNEIAKFKFLNEIIKILSPKYLGAQTNDRVKQKAVELLYTWRKTMPHLGKIVQAYDMLKTQSIIQQDPTYLDEALAEPIQAAEQQQMATFEDQEKSKLLSELLRSKRPDDLVAANRLIKSMVKAEDQKMEKITKRSIDLDAARSNAQLLSEMVSQYNGDQQDVDVMKDLVSSLTAIRPSLFRYAGEAAEGQEDSLAEVLLANDIVSKSIDEYKARVESSTTAKLIDAAAANQQQQASYLMGHTTTGRTGPQNGTGQPIGSGVSALLELDLGPVGNPGGRINPPAAISPDGPSTTSLTSTDDVIMIPGNVTPAASRRNPPTTGSAAVKYPANLNLDELLSTNTETTKNHQNARPATSALANNLSSMLNSTAAPSSATNGGGGASVISPAGGAAVKALPVQKGLQDLSALSDSLILQNLPDGTKQSTFQKVQTIEQQRQKVPMRELPISGAGNKSSYNTEIPSFSPLDPVKSSKSPIDQGCEPTVPSSKSTADAPTNLDGKLVDFEPPTSNPGNNDLPLISDSSSGGGSSEKSASQPAGSGSTNSVIPSTTTSTPHTNIPNHVNPNMKPATAPEPKPNPKHPSLADISVSLTDVKPGTKDPILVLNDRQLKVLCHHTANQLKDGVSLLVLSTSSTLTKPLSAVKLSVSCAAESDVIIRCETPTANSLPGYNPIFPQSAITQLLLVSYLSQEKPIRLNYSLSWTESGESAIPGGHNEIAGDFTVRL